MDPKAFHAERERLEDAVEQAVMALLKHMGPVDEVEFGEFKVVRK